MILIDMSQIILSNVLFHLTRQKKIISGAPEIPLLSIARHMVFNSLRAINLQNKSKYGQMVLCFDGRNSWRKEIFPYYKKNRQEDKKKSVLDWEEIYTVLSTLRTELMETICYPCVFVNEAEGDDVIAYLVNTTDEKILIVSNDQDFYQLAREDLDQYDPINKKMLSHPVDFDRHQNLIDHIIEGDKGDGIPNIYSADDACLDKTKMVRLSPKKKAEMRELIRASAIHETEYSKNYNRNKTLVDLSLTPETLQNKIKLAYDKETSLNKNRSMMMDYFVKNKLKVMREKIGDF